MFEASNVRYATDEKFKDKYKGESCLIIGGMYRNYAKNNEYERCRTLDKWRHYVMGCNSAYKVRKVDFLVWVDINFSNIYKEELKKLKCDKFIAYPTKWECLDFDYYGVRCGIPDLFSRSFDQGIYPYNNSGIFALTIAVALGFNRIILTGFCPTGRKEKKIAENYIMFKRFNVFTTDTYSTLRQYFTYMKLTEALTL